MNSDHVIVCGFGHVGYRAADLLLRLHERVTVVYDNAPADWLARVQTQGATCIQGDARSDSVLQAAGIAQARAVLAVTDRDLVNLETAVDARRLNPQAAVVLRLFDTALAPHLEDVLGVRQALSSSALAAPVFASAALGQDALGFLTLGGRTFVLTEKSRTAPAAATGMPVVSVSADNSVQAAGGTGNGSGPEATLSLEPALNDAAPAPTPVATGVSRARMHPLLELLVRIPGPIKTVLVAIAGVILFSTVLFHFCLDLPYVTSFYFVITTITTVGYGDVNLLQAPWYLQLYGSFVMLCGAALLATLFGVFTDFLLRTRFRALLAGQPMPPPGHVIVAGLGNLGYRITRNLRQAASGVVCVGQERDGVFAEALQRLVPVVLDDPRQEQALQAAGIATARAVVAGQDDDVANLGLALAARKLNPNIRTVVRVFDGALGAKLQHYLKIDRVLSLSAVAAPVFVGAALFPRVVHAFVWRQRLVVVCLHPAGTAPTPAVPGPGGAGTRIAFAVGGEAGQPRLLPPDGAPAAAPLPRLEFMILPLADAP